MFCFLSMACYVSLTSPRLSLLHLSMLPKIMSCSSSGSSMSPKASNLFLISMLYLLLIPKLCKPNIGIMALFVQTLDFWPYYYTHWNLIPSFETLIPSFETLKYWNSGPIFKTLQFSFYSSKHWNSGPIFVHIGFLILFFKTLGFWSYFQKKLNSDLILPNIGSLYLYKEWNSAPILPNTGIVVLFL